jgi:hypothetical protein
MGEHKEGDVNMNTERRKTRCGQPIRSRAHGSLGVLLTLPVMACAGGDEAPARIADKQGESAQALVTRGGYWPHPHLDVCFKTPDTAVGVSDFRPRYMAAVAAAFANYTNLDIGFHGACGDGPDQYNWVRVQFLTAGPGDSGRSSAKTPDELDFGGYWPNAAIYMDDTRGPAVWTHEMTHSAGFHHTQDAAGSLCTRQPGQTGGGRALGPYDPASLMSYCYESAKLADGTEPARFSDLDLMGLDIAYGAPGQITYGADGAVYRHRTVVGSAQDLRCTVQSGEQLSAFTGLRGAPAGSPDDTFRTGSDRAEADRSPLVYDVGACAYPPGFYAVAGTIYMVVGDQIEYDGTSDALHVQTGAVCRVVNPNQAALFGADALIHTVSPSTNLWIGRTAQTMAETPPCAWGDGYYRLGAEPTVYRLSGTGVTGATPTACAVVTPVQLAALQQVGQHVAATEPYGAVAPWVADQGTQLADLLVGRPLSAPGGTPPACAWPTGFYTSQGTTYRVDPGAGTYCHVADPTQLAQYLGTTGATYDVTGQEFFLGFTNQGVCRWPNGTYAWSGELFQVAAGQVCHVQSAQQAQRLAIDPAKARDVTNDPSFFVDSTWIGACGWPAGLYQQGAALFAIGAGPGDTRLPHYPADAVYHSPVDPIGDICQLVNPAQQAVYAGLAPTPSFTPTLFTGAPILVAADAELGAQRTRPNATQAIPQCPWINADYRRANTPGAPLYTLRKTGVNRYDGSINYECAARGELAPGQPAPAAIAACAGASAGAACLAFEAPGGNVFAYASRCALADDHATLACAPYALPDPVAADIWQCPIDPALHALTATCSDAPCRSDSTIRVAFAGMADVPHGFITLAPAGAGAAWYLGRQDTLGQDSGAATFPSPGPGTWVARAVAPQGNGEFAVRAETPTFTVSSPTNGLVQLACSDVPCSDASTLTVSYANAPTADDYFHYGYVAEIAPKGGQTNQFLSFAYSQPPTASLTLPAAPDPIWGTVHTLPPAVVARLFLYYPSKFLSESAPLTVLPNLAVTCSAAPCAAGSTVTVSYLDLPADAWIELLPAGTPPRTPPIIVPWVGYHASTTGAHTGTVRFTIDGTTTGGWIARAYQRVGTADTIFGPLPSYAQIGLDSAAIALGG